MRNRRFVALAFVCLLFLATIAALALRDTEPRYNGKRLSQWLGQVEMRFNRLVVAPDAQEAILHIGTNAIPTALRWISHETPGWTAYTPVDANRAIPAIVQKLTAPFRRNETLAEQRATGARNIFAILGPTAQPAIPQLKHLALTTSDEPRIANCLSALSYTGPEALPVLLEIIKERQGEPSPCALHAIGCTPTFGTNAVPAVPVLIDCLHDTNDFVVAAASDALGKIALSPSVAVPALAAVLSHPTARRRNAATIAITHYGEAAVPQLQHVITNANSDLRSVQAAKYALQIITHDTAINASSK